jgi:hypothetical protein
MAVEIDLCSIESEGTSNGSDSTEREGSHRPFRQPEPCLQWKIFIFALTLKSDGRSDIGLLAKGHTG